MIESYVRNPVKVTVGALLVVLFGIIGLYRMPMQLTPEVEIPTISIETRWPGAAPEDVETEIINKQEEQLKSVEGVTKMTSESSDSSGRITLEFPVGTDMQEALLKVNTRLQQVENYPENAREPIISTSDANARAIAWFILRPKVADANQISAFIEEHPDLREVLQPALRGHNSGVRLARLRSIAEEHPEVARLLPDPSLDITEYRTFAEEYIEARFERVPGVANANVLGGREEEIQVIVDPQQLAIRRLTVEDVRQALQGANIDTSAGDTWDGKRRYVVRTEGRFRKPEDVLDVIIRPDPGRVFVRDIVQQQPWFRIVVDPNALTERNLTIQDVQRALPGSVRGYFEGDVWSAEMGFTLRTKEPFAQTPYPDERIILDAVVRSTDDGPIRVEDVIQRSPDGRLALTRESRPRVELGYKKPDGVVRRYGSSTIAINAERAVGSNVLEVMKGLRAAVQELNDQVLQNREIPLELEQVYDETEYIYSAIDLVNTNILIGGFLTVCVLLIFLRNARSTLVIGIAIPTSIIGTFLILNMLDRSLNVISLAGLAFAVGMLVDNAVVVLENIYQHYQRGKSPMRASVDGASEVRGAVLSSTLTTLAVFIPVVFVEEQAGQLFRDIALAVSGGVALSLIVSLTVIPMAASRLLKRRPKGSRAGVESGDGDGRPSWPRSVNGSPNGSHPPSRLRRAGTTALGFIDRPAGWFVGGLMNLNTWLQRRAYRRLATLLVFVGLAGGMIWLIWPKVEYLPTGNRNLVFGILQPPPGYNLAELVDLGEQLEGNMRPYWDVDLDSAEAENLKYPPIRDFFYVARGRMVFVGVRAADPSRAKELVGLVQEASGSLPGVFGIANQSSLFERGLTAGRTVDIEITGPDIDKLLDIGRGVMGQVGQVIPGGRAFPQPSLDKASPEVEITLKNVKAAEVGLNEAQLGYAVDALIDGAFAGNYYKGSTEIDLRIIAEDLDPPTPAPANTYIDPVLRELPVYRSTSVEDIPNLWINTPSGKLVQIRSVADVTITGTPEQIAHRQRLRAITIQVTPPEEMPLEEAVAQIQEQIVQPLVEQGTLGDEYQITLSGTADKLQQTWEALYKNFILALLITYLLMAALFESWLYPLVVILSVPMGALGGFLGLWVLNLWVVQSLDVLTMLGFVMLIGTVVNNPILIVEQALINIRELKMSYRDAVLKATRTRVRPIFMTTLTTVLGLMPLVLFPGAGSELYRGIGSVLLGGLLVSAFVTLVLVPSVFSLFLEGKEWTINRLGLDKQDEEELDTMEAPVLAPHHE